MQLGQQKRRDYLEKGRQYDRPPIVDVGDSIREMRRIYKNYSNAEFAAWYSARYGVRMEAVLAVIQGGGSNAKG